MTDAEVSRLVRAGVQTQAETLQMIASENIATPQVKQLLGSPATDWLGDVIPARTYAGAGDPTAALAALARQRACALFGADYANMTPHSGSAANLAACMAVLQPGDTLLGLHMDSGGHISHGAERNLSGILFRAVGYHIDPDTELVDLDALRDLALRERPRAIVCGASTYPRAIDAKPYRDICDEVGAALIFDAANSAAFIVAGKYPDPVGAADVVTFTTHKTMRGPRGAGIVSSAQLGARLDPAVSPGVQGTPLPNVLAAAAASLAEAAAPDFASYVVRVLENAQALAAALEAAGVRLLAGGTETHVVVADLRTVADLGGGEAVRLLDRAGISATRCPVGADPRWPDDTSGVRLGTLTASSLGMGPAEMTVIAELVLRVLRGRDDRSIDEVRAAVRELRLRFPQPA